MLLPEREREIIRALIDKSLSPKAYQDFCLELLEEVHRLQKQNFIYRLELNEEMNMLRNQLEQAISETICHNCGKTLERDPVLLRLKPCRCYDVEQDQGTDQQVS